jgi:hypothetical protein
MMQKNERGKKKRGEKKDKREKKGKMKMKIEKAVGGGDDKGHTPCE